MGGRWRRWSVVAAAVGVVLLPVLPSRAATGDVEVDHFRFSPGELHIDVGDRVKWTNRGDEDHSVVADDSSFDSGRVEPGKSYERRFGEAGSFPYHCDLHPGMTGVIRVGETTTTTAPPETAPTPTTTAAAAPSATQAPEATSSTAAAPTTTTSTTTTATTASTTTTAAGSTTTTTAALPSSTIPAEAHAAARATTGHKPASGEHARAVEAKRAMGSGDNGPPNRLAVAAFVAVFVPVAMGIAAGARRLLRGRA